MDTIVIVVVVVVVAALLIVVARSGAKVCPQCGTQLPPIRKPGSLRQMLWGGWTCPSCNSEIDRRGKIVAR